MSYRPILHSVLIFLLLGGSQLASGQQFSKDVRRVIGSAGGYDSTSSLRVSYTIGEPVVHTASTQEEIYTQGFHQGPMVPVEDFKIETYNAFSPNGDGTNESWIIEQIEYYPDNQVIIYNRWGDRVRRFDGYNNADKVWKGNNSNGQPLPASTYYYLIRTEQGKTKKGYVQITK